jgi:hypothetical protein
MSHRRRGTKIVLAGEHHGSVLCSDESLHRSDDPDCFWRHPPAVFANVSVTVHTYA